MTWARKQDPSVDSWRAKRWPQIEVRMLSGACAEAAVIGILGYTLTTDAYDAFDVEAIRASARWLRVPSARLYDLTIAARRPT